MNKRLANIGFWAVTGFFLFAAVQMMAPEAQSATEKKQYTEVLEAARDHKLNQLKVVGNEITGTMQTKDGHTVQFKSTLTEFDRDAITEIRKTGTAIDVEDPPGTPWYLSALGFIAYPILFVGLFIMAQRLMMGGKGGPGGVGKSPGKLMDNTKTKKVTFADVAGVDEARAEVAETIDFLRDPRKYTALGGRMPKGTLLVGPPGTGKTLLAKAVAGEAGVPFYSVSGSDFVEMFVGVGASRVRDLFAQAKKNAPCILFIDEIDGVGKSRNSSGGGLGGNDEREQTLNQLLVEMDGFDNSEGVIIMAATNRADTLDPALTRAGRFDRQITVNRPTLNGREAILNVHVRNRNVPLAENTDLNTVARGTTGFSGADLEMLVNEAALVGARKGKTAVDIKDFEEARERILMGATNKSMVLSDADKERTAWHEAGHALIGLLVEGNDPVHKVTIVPRGQALGITAMLPKEDRHSITENQLRAQLAMMYGGRIAEEITYGRGNVSTGAQNDIDRATEIAKNMVTEWGFSEKLGAVNYGSKQQNAFFGAANADQSPKLKEDIESERNQILVEAQAAARKVLETHPDKLKAITDALLLYETIDETDLDDIMNGRPLRTPNIPPSTSGPAPMHP